MNQRIGGFHKAVIALMVLCVAGFASHVVFEPLGSKTEASRMLLSVPIGPELGEQLALAERRPGNLRTQDIDRVFKELGYDLDSVVSGERKVPRLLLSRIPEDLHTLREVSYRKDMFIMTVLPLVLEVNMEYRRDRQRILRLRRAIENGTPINALDRWWLVSISQRYGLSEVQFDKLLEAVDEIPPSLALVQAAVESGWGTSRFSRKGNALFGQWTFRRNGLIPQRRDEGKKHRVRSFNALIDGVRSYMRNLNSNRAYAEFRALRAALRRAGKVPDGLTMAGTLTRYSERGQDYVNDLRDLITANRLQGVDRATLGVRRVDINLASLSP